MKYTPGLIVAKLKGKVIQIDSKGKVVQYPEVRGRKMGNQRF